MYAGATHVPPVMQGRLYSLTNIVLQLGTKFRAHWGQISGLCVTRRGGLIIQWMSLACS